ncbi:MAG: D-alanyl-D-alanine carboxypeptidase [Hyphomonadaceae bacterium]|nr:MAG: D-alanyl-D-alanine carboxypeptidase (penicillin-binding protein 5/6) [Caulobacteraceae bacterium]MBT9445122.1 D-alanyl-D-alanine carboxypeptidase [Hyphomonadaceae bacterium]TPW08446.1 MAG: D-alanyl-D-alanine carboxypeptidase (penicillin-binding protein 5/6) [Alphaproteobacteria bacterium]
MGVTRLPSLAALGLCLLLAAAPAVRAQAPDPVVSAAQHIAILDHGTGQMLYCRDCDVAMPPASMSKLMTMLIVADQLRAKKITLDTQLPVSENAWRHGAQSDGSHMFLDINSRVRVEDLIKGVVIVSANDACIVLAEGIAGSETAFVALMNQRAREIGLSSAQFRNVTGLPDPDHIISSRDLARVTSLLIRDYPELYRHYAERSFTYNGKTQENRNPLLGRVEGADGVKTGHTSVSGYGLIGSAQVNDQRRIIVFNGLPSMAARSAEAQRLMRAALFDFTVTSLFAKDAVVGQADVWLGSRSQVPLVATHDVSVAAHRSAYAGMTAHIVYEGPLQAPIKKGAVIARLVIEGPGVHEEFPLAAGVKVGRANPFARAVFGLQQILGGG